MLEASWRFHPETSRCADLTEKRVSEAMGYTRIQVIYIYMGVSENSVPLNPMVNDHYPY